MSTNIVSVSCIALSALLLGAAVSQRPAVSRTTTGTAPSISTVAIDPAAMMRRAPLDLPRLAAPAI